MATYKEQHEAFVSNHSGTSTLEVQVVVSSILAAYSLCLAISPFFAHRRCTRIVRFFGEFVVLVVPTVVCFTKAQYAPIICGSLFGLTLILRWRGYGAHAQCARDKKPVDVRRADVPSFASSASSPAAVNPRTAFLSAYRATMMLCVCIGILAVDFPVFPRRFAKTENYGTSLMDAGVGSMVLSAGIMAGRPSSRQKASLWRTLLSCVPLVVLGLARLAAVKGVDYQEHVSEYGVHCNFFLVMAAVSAMYALFVRFLPKNSEGIVGVVLLVGHQLALMSPGLSWYIAEVARDGIVSANKEGIFSLPGNFALFLIGAWVGRHVWSSPAALTPNRPSSQSLWFLIRILAVDAAIWIVYNASRLYIEESSRKMVNATYVLWMLGYNGLFLAGMYAVHALVGSAADECALVRSINRNQLAIFLFANLLTGAVNLSLHTITTPDSAALLLLSVYMLVTCAAATTMDALNITAKFW